MQELLFQLASSKTSWLAARQAAVAANIANINTAGYRPVDVKAFTDILDGGSLNAPGLSPEDSLLGSVQSTNAAVRKGWEVQQSGNSVSLEQEMLKGGEIQQDYALSVGITKSFNRMLLAAARG
jgi:flagellar basal-body rod protein FlgB